MTLHNDQYFSIRAMRVLLRFVGFWIAENKSDQIIIDGTLLYTQFAVSFAALVETLELYHLSGDLYDMAYIICNAMTVLTALFKLLIMTWHRNSIIDLISFSLNEFWHKNFKSHETHILKYYEQQSIFLISAFVISAIGAGCGYMIRPIVENIGKNATDRIHPFKMWFDMPLTTTPYFEIAYAVEMVITVHVGICFFCFDILLCVLNVHVSGQLEILQSRLERIYDENCIKSSKTHHGEKMQDFEKSKIFYNNFCNCIKFHDKLIWYVEEIERIFTIVILGQMLISSLLMCLSGFQIISGEGAITKRYIFISYTFGCVIQLITYTFTCNEITVASLKLSGIAFHANWYAIPYDKTGKSIRYGIQFFMQRTQRPLCLTAGGFFPVSLDSFIKAISTSLSYFAILRERGAEVS